MTDQLLKTSVVRIRDGSPGREGGRVVGCGFLVSSRHVLTCAHVVDQAETPTRQVFLDFPFSATREVVCAWVAFRQPAHPVLEYPPADGLDVALLHLQDAPPPDSSPARLVPPGDVWKHPGRAFGFPAGRDEGVWAEAVLRDTQANGWIQLDATADSHGYFIAPGFSGTPVWDERLGGVVGMVVAADGQTAVRAAYLIPTPVLTAAIKQAEKVLPSEPLRQKIGEFELLTELGRGGMGVVYRAWQPSLGRQVALKCVHRGRGAHAADRFDREVHALGRVNNPHLVAVYTSGSVGDLRYYAMELIEGAPLRAVRDKLAASCPNASRLDWHTWQAAVSTVSEECRQAEKPVHDGTEGGPQRPPVPVEGNSAQATAQCLAGRSYILLMVELVRQVAEAADALHRAGIIHRDIKPDNIMVTADGSKAVLMDLGIARLVDEGPGRLTRTRQFVGTYRYASPEQVLAHGKIDRRTDVYSLGVTLWEMLTLRPMYGATDQTPTVEVMERVEYEDPEPLRKYHPGIGPTWRSSSISAWRSTPTGATPPRASWPRTCSAFSSGNRSRPGRPVRGSGPSGGRSGTGP